MGKQANVAFSLMLFLGAWRGDASRLGPKKMKDGVMIYVPRKTKYKRLEPSIKPILPPLLEAIRRTPIGLQSLLVNQLRQAVHARWIGRVVQRGRTARVFLARPQEGCRPRFCANMGATDRRLMALFDWQSEKQANVHTLKANKTKLAADCARLLGQFFWRCSGHSENRVIGFTGAHPTPRGLTEN